ncbi:hypothetical protein N7481_012575 [Penicillium waksmanii]|uniref:uncharacterized protein n=1 Tax=Penicillium waksmanii TaxID=69791 RepID=UPI002548D08B|nr:uncharacterized protein N7481_012575 [Penicillium waksmanii]KAJ5965861.1 hypothetical protein N7481_012575 [Penicillium waksmanii]
MDSSSPKFELDEKHSENTGPAEAIDTGLAEVEAEKAEPDKGPSLGNYLRILSYGARNGGIVAIILGLVCAMGSGVALPLMNIVFGNQVGNFNQYFTPGSSLNEETFKATVNRNSLYIVYLFIGKFALTYVSMVCFRLISLQASAALRLQYLQALFSLPISRLDEVSSGSVTHAITSLSNQIQHSVSDKLALLFQSLALLVSAYAIAFRYSWALTLVVSSAILFVVLGFSLTIPFIVKAQYGVDQADQKHASIAADVLASIRTVLSLNAEAPLIAKHSAWIDEARRRGSRMSVVTGIHLGLLFFAMYVSFGLAFWFGLKLYREGHIGSINVVITVFFSVLLVVTILGSIASPIIIIGKAISASRPFFDIIDSQQPVPTGLRDPDVSSETDITFDGVTFAYPTRPNTKVLRDFHACFQRGKTTALVGASGSGKVPSVGDVNINDLDIKWWRSQIGLVQQEPFLFNDTIFNNVAFGLLGSQQENEPETVKVDLVITACKEAFADDFIQYLPLGYSTLVGEGGITLSGGQRQRIAIARSVVRRPPILILDEATSSIDVHGERIVQAALDRVSKDQTTIIIAHRLSTVRRADHIIVMKDGLNVEAGSHIDLLAKGGVYQGLVNAQKLISQTISESVVDEEEDLRLPQVADGNPGNTIIRSDDSSRTNNEFQSQDKGSSNGFLRILSQQRVQWPLYLLTLVGVLGAASGFALQSWLFAQLIQTFQFSGQKLVNAANFWALMFFILALAMAAFYFTIGVGSNSISVNVASTYRKEYFLNMITQRVAWFDRDENTAGALISRLSTDPKQLQELFGISGAFPLVSIFSVIGCIAISFSFGPKLAAVAFCAGTPFMFLGAFARIRYEMKFEAINAEVYAESSRFASEAIRAFRTVTSLTIEDFILKRYSEQVTTQRHRAMRKAWYATLMFAFADSFELCSMALTFWYGGQLLASREYDVVTFFVVYVAIIQGGQSAGQFLSFGPNIAQATASGSRILSLGSESNGCVQSSHVVPLPSTREKVQADIQFEDVSFQYPSRDVPTFTGLNLNIQSGQFVAFVGPSGCGKSTIISLLERFYDATQGTVLLGGRDIRSIELSSYRNALSLVSQEPKLFDGTIRDNLLLGLADTNENTESQMVQACQDAEIDGFITFSPRRLLHATRRQRASRAEWRPEAAHLHRTCIDPLDSQSESLIREAMERLAAKRDMTIIAVAHRLATIQKADTIFVFGQETASQGTRVLEKGTHTELLQNWGAYWEMCQAQALDQ